jgi:hypothetical protein
MGPHPYKGTQGTPPHIPPHFIQQEPFRMTRREIAARLIVERCRDYSSENGDFEGWLKLATYQAWDDAGVILAAIRECENHDQQ